MRSGIVAILGLVAMVSAAGAQQAKTATVTTEAPATVSQAPQAQTEAALRSLQAMKDEPARTACPGQLIAQQQATGVGTVWTTAYEDKGDKADWIARPRGLGIHVEFANAKTAVQELELRVSYLPLGLRSMPADGAQLTNGVERSPQEKAKTFNLDREAAMRVGGDLLVGPAATITRVHLISATFADGSVWRASSDDQCSIVPSKFMLVEAKK